MEGSKICIGLLKQLINEEEKENEDSTTNDQTTSTANAPLESAEQRAPCSDNSLKN